MNFKKICWNKKKFKIFQKSSRQTSITLLLKPGACAANLKHQKQLSPFADQMETAALNILQLISK